MRHERRTKVYGHAIRLVVSFIDPPPSVKPLQQ